MIKRLITFSLFLFSSALMAEPLKVGITLHPYYAYVSNIVKDRAEIVPLVDAGFNPHSYELQPADLKRLMTMDALVVNGIGHDEFAFRALEALEAQNGKQRKKIKVILANQDVPLLAAENTVGAWNPHTFVSISAAIRQVYTIAKNLGELDPNNAKFYKKNAVQYARKLRKLKNQYAQALNGLDLSGIRIASTHNAYGYFLQEFGIGIDTVIEPAHGVEPSASQLKGTIDRIRDAQVQVLFTELNMDYRYVETVEKATGIGLYHFSHLTFGEYDAELVYREMEHNLKTLVKALKSALADEGAA
ncbi:metal ABC transporter solute-binding protein, Zn/Mn family [Neptuniibacter sp. SY11_33]|uniref:metal ABC transporter solute-binding protein, Zn/Mn family n=1 Tax=Neptuniibacter sp. SY11_33 TaxID=3398215 RepID=UPI0039F63FCB